jgi:hypothetical protein
MDLVRAQMLEKAPLDGGEVTALSRFDEAQPGLGEVRVNGARVRVDASAFDETSLLKSIDDPRDPAQAEPALLSEVGHAEVAPVGGAEAAQYLERAEGQAVLGLELGVERADEVLVGLQQADPGVSMDVRPTSESVLPEDVGTGLAD